MSFFANQSVSAQKLYKTSVTHSGLIIGGSVGLVGGSWLIENAREPLTPADILVLNDGSINGVDKGAANNYSLEAGSASDLFKNGVFAAPLALFLSDQGRENAREIMMMYAEVLSFNSGLTYITKSSVARYRPYAYNPSVSFDIKLGKSSRRSFYSGHVSHVASLSFFTANIFDDLYPDSKYKYAVWAGAIAAPAITAYLRVKAGSHFPTDVVVGYGIGALIGYFVPELHKITKHSDVEIIGAEGGLGLLYNF